MDTSLKRKIDNALLFTNYVPKNKILYGVILFLKIIPLFVITHDWNISSKKGISFWIRKATLSEFLSTSSLYYFYIGIIIILFFVFIYIHVIQIILYFHKIKLIYTKIYGFLIFHIIYGLNQYIYSIFMEILFNNKKKDLPKFLFYTLSVIIALLVISFTYLNVLLSTLVINEPTFLKNESFLINPLNQIEFKTALLSFFQCIIQLEFHLSFKNMMLIKNIVRGLFILYYLKEMFTFNGYYCRFYVEYFQRFYTSLCFISCVIEWFFFYDYKNKLMILQRDFGIIVLKLIIEINLSVAICSIYFYFDNRILKRKILKFNSKNIKSFDYNLIKFFNMLYYKDRQHLLKKILRKLNQILEKSIHNPKCKDLNCYYCYEYSFYEFNFQMDNFFSKININKSNFSLEKEFPLLYKYLYNEISAFYDNFSYGKKSQIIPKIFIVISFFLLFEKNYMKCLYIIEKINSSEQEKKNTLYTLQNGMLINKILDLSKLKGNGHKKISLFNSNNENVDKILKAEQLIKISLNTIKTIMNNFNNDIVEFSSFSKMITNFNKEYKIISKKINHLFGDTKCNIPYSKQKFSIYFNYIYGEIPKNLILCFDKFFSLQNSSLIEIIMKNTYLLLFTVNFTIKDINLQVKYASEDLINKLRYTTNEFRNLDINKLFAKTFYKSYKYTISSFLKNGNELLSLNNFCLLDKDKYVVLFDVEGTSLYTIDGIILFLRLKDTKEQKLIKDSKINKKGKNNKNLKNFCGSCFLFTNSSGRIVSLSRGFEDFFYLKYEVLKQNNLNVKDIFKISKLEKQGYYEGNLFDVYDNIIEVFTDKIGLIGEDEFSKSIIQIQDVKSNLLLSNTDFMVNVNYEMREMKREEKKIKIYYLFFIDVSIKESRPNLVPVINSCFSDVKKEEKTPDLSSYSENVNAPRTVIDKIIHTSMKQKILYSNKLSYYILKKFFKIKIEIPKRQFLDEEMNELLEEEEIKVKKNQNYQKYNINQSNINEKKIINEISNDNIINQKEEKQNDKNEDIKKYMAINQKNSSFLGYFVVSLATIIIILYIPFLTKKLDSLTNNKNYLLNNLNYHMSILILDDIILRVLWMQIQGNNLQDELIDKGFNNSFSTHLSFIEHYMYDYNAFYIQVNQFITTKLLQSDLSFFEASQNNMIYKIPSRTGKKMETYISFKNLHIPILLHPIQEVGKIEIYYNNSDYYFNESMVNQTDYSFEDYYYAALGYIGILLNFQTGYKFYNIETINHYNQKILFKEANNEKLITNVMLIILSIFASYNFFCWYIFYSQTTQLFARYLVVHTQLRFFNNYLMRKTIIIYEYIDNNSNNFKVQKAISEIEFENEFEQILTIKHICSGQIENFKLIKIRPLSIKYNPTQFLTQFEDIDNKNKEESSKELYLHTIIKNSDIKKKKSNFQKQLSIQQTNVSVNHKLSPAASTHRKSGSVFSKNNNEEKENSNKLSLPKIKDKPKERSSKRLTQRSNVSNSTFQSSINLLNHPNNTKNGLFLNNNKPKNEIGHRLLSKPLLYIGLFIFLIFLSIILITVGLIHYEISLSTRNTFKDSSSTLNSIFSELKYIKELLMNFQTTILLNKEFNFEYKGNKYSIICDEIKDNFLQNSTHEIFSETSFCFPFVKKKVDDLTQGQGPSILKRIIKFQKEIEGKKFCEFFSKTLYEIKEYKKIKDLRISKTINKEQIKEHCDLIGGDFNKEGISITLTGIFTTLNNMYNDFKRNKNRTGEYNLQLLNDPNLLIFQAEHFSILSRIPLCYYVLGNQDIISTYYSVIENETIFLIIEVTLMSLGIIVYIYFVILYGREISSVDFFNKSILHMILFK